MQNLDLSNLAAQGLSLAAIVGAFMRLVPEVAAFAALVWYIILIYQSATVQHWLHARRVRKIAKLKREMAKLEATEMIVVDKKKHRESPHFVPGDDIK